MQYYNIFSASFHLFVFLFVLPHSTDFKSNLIQCFAVVFTNFIYFYSVFRYSSFSSYFTYSTSSTLSFSIYLSSSLTLSHTIIFLLPSYYSGPPIQIQKNIKFCSVLFLRYSHFLFIFFLLRIYSGLVCSFLLYFTPILFFFHLMMSFPL